ncbi:tellurite resistance protein TehB [Gallibacterium salpingitidis]|uniref:Tellurite resistance protein TehB n=1 Tax=Gallibacterium salpingitidis TaxID=505341 RepID=A0A1A7Q008_9PAST|nr:SAM-dependent methyltransferase TehB [Gallibacterium salpingitidis]OBW96233.1 tellurite resistance protein TehB [Gallibacterium salpingitidis]OBX07621.1 tellurite resistance protein TehB [Gallibacterium salpingitidis]OBX08173.1 tellurite resistance protein TehB [Gallibacterium salpingitidis]WKS98849.1 SAM-dependent methyltransferase TehB [Gallibacterium salpingitidis]
MQETLIAYKTMPVWNNKTLPAMFQEKHNTKVGTWGQLRVLKGKLKFYQLNEEGEVLSEHLFTPESDIPLVEPQAWHRVESASDDLECQLSFLCRRSDYFSKKYNLTATHSEVKAASEILTPCKVLDLGCGQGRNSLYLSMLGYDVTSWDHNPTSIQFLNEMAEKEQLSVKTALYDINSANIQENYDFIVSTVVFMFLNAQAVPNIIANMQQHTNIGGYNLIVAAMNTADVPCPMPFSFTFKEDELRNYYQGWELIKYQEEMGELHKTDANGNRIKMKFVTMLAKKIA